MFSVFMSIISNSVCNFVSKSYLSHIPSNAWGQIPGAVSTGDAALRFRHRRSASGKQRKEQQQQQHNGCKPAERTSCAGTAGIAAVMTEGDM
jgi:hypothetical protein